MDITKNHNFYYPYMVCPLIWQFVENVRFLVIMCIGLYQEVEYFTDKNGEITHDVIHKKKNNQIWTTQKMYITSVIHIHCREYKSSTSLYQGNKAIHIRGAINLYCDLCRMTVQDEYKALC